MVFLDRFLHSQELSVMAQPAQEHRPRKRIMLTARLQEERIILSSSKHFLQKM